LDGVSDYVRSYWLANSGRRKADMITKRVVIPHRAILVVLFAACPAHGDLYTDGVLTLDWLVDSADEIHRVRFVPRESDGGLVSEPLETLKPKSGESALKREDVARLRPPRSPRSGEWLFFVRLTEIGQAALVRGVSLEHPMASYRTAAFTRNGTPLRDRDSILAATKARIALGRSLPARCDQTAVEAMIGHAPSSGRTDLPWAAYPFGDPAPLQQYLGGMLVRISCEDWDNEGPYDVDTWLNVAVVPVEPGDHERLLEAARLGEKYKGPPRYCHPIACLVNFPGKRTEEFLHEVQQNPRARRTDELTAAHVLSYFHYHLEATDPLNNQLVGSWRLEGQRERIDIELEKDNTFTATAWDFRWDQETKEIPCRTWRGKGYWVVRDGKLSILRSHYGMRRSKSWHRNEREIFANKPILEVTDTAVVLKSGPPMTRKPATPPPYAKSPSPDHIEIRRDLADCPRFGGPPSYRFLSFGVASDGESYAAEFRNPYRQKVTLLFANYEYWTDDAKKQNIQPVLFHYYDEQKKVDYYYEVSRRSNDEQLLAGIVRRAFIERGGLKRDDMEPRERLKWLEARLRDRQPVVEKPKE